MRIRGISLVLHGLAAGDSIRFDCGSQEDDSIRFDYKRILNDVVRFDYVRLLQNVCTIRFD